MARSVTLEDLYRLHMNDIFRYLLRLTGDRATAEDLTQEAFFRAFQFWERFDGGQVRPWLFKVAYHAFIDLHRRQKRVVPTGLSQLAERSDPHTPAPEQELMDQEAWRLFSEVIATFPDKQRQVLILRYYHDLRYDEIADILTISESDVKSSLFRGRQRLRKVWKEEKPT